MTPSNLQPPNYPPFYPEAPRPFAAAAQQPQNSPKPEKSGFGIVGFLVTLFIAAVSLYLGVVFAEPLKEQANKFLNRKKNKETPEPPVKPEVLGGAAVKPIYSPFGEKTVFLKTVEQPTDEEPTEEEEADDEPEEVIEWPETEEEEEEPDPRSLMGRNSKKYQQWATEQQEEQ